MTSPSLRFTAPPEFKRDATCFSAALAEFGAGAAGFPAGLHPIGRIPAICGQARRLQ